MLKPPEHCRHADSMIQAIDARSRDDLGGSPCFTVRLLTMWVPLQVGASTAYHPDPRQGRQNRRSLPQAQCTLFVTTPTFLRFCLNAAKRRTSNRCGCSMCGAEKLPAGVAQEFQQKFGILPMEGYVARSFRPRPLSTCPTGRWTVSGRLATSRHHRPAASRVTPASSIRNLSRPAAGAGGMLLIYGPNVHGRISRQAELTKEVIRDGWYVTGDWRATMRTASSRLPTASRFSKIGARWSARKIEGSWRVSWEPTNAGVRGHERGGYEQRRTLVVLHLPLNGVSPESAEESWKRKGCQSVAAAREGLHQSG